jgi:hypothetical protein
MVETAEGHRFVGAWLVSYRIGKPPSVLDDESPNPLSAEGLMVFNADGTFVAHGSPVYSNPTSDRAEATLLAGAGVGHWKAVDEYRAAVSLAVVLRSAHPFGITGNSVATLFFAAHLELDAAHDSLSGAYSVDVHLSRYFSRDLPPLDGSVQAWRAPVAGEGV